MKQSPVAATECLQQARQALARQDVLRADALYLQCLEHARNDAAALAEYGQFCLRTERNEEAAYLLWKAIRLGMDSADAWAALGHARLEIDEIADARQAFERALGMDRQHAIAGYGLAQCLLREHAWPQAVAALDRVRQAQPDNLPVLVNLATACGQAGDTARAAAFFSQAERMAPGEPAVLLEAGRFHRDAGDWPRALLRLQHCLRAWPDEPQIRIDIARCQRAMGDVASALASLDAIETIAPELPECRVERGHCLAAGGDAAGRDEQWEIACRQWLEARQFERAEPLLAQMLQAAPDSPATWNSKGSFHDLQQQLEPAEAAYRRALELSPDLLPAHVNLGNLYETSNRLDEALTHAQTALRIAATLPDASDPVIGAAHLLRARLARRQKDYGLAIEHLDAAARIPGPDVQVQTVLFERGRILDALDDTDAAIAAFTRANAIARPEPGVDDPDGNKFSRGVDYLLELIDRGWLETWKLPSRDPPPGEASPVILLGFPRSGTTLLNTVLFSHSQIAVLEEKQTFGKALGLARRMPGGYPHTLPGCDALDAQLLRETYWRAVGELCALRPGQLLIDKFPFYLTLAGLIHVAFPQAKFLFAQRHPCDAVLSCFMQNFRLNEAMANFRTLGQTASIYDRTMRLWTVFRERLGLNVHTIRYEGMVDDFDGQVRALCDFLGVPWEDSLRQFSSKALDRGKINTPSYEQVSQPIYRQARGRWQRYRRHLEPHLPLLQPWIERYGYHLGG
ncbi:MAG: sulfotransferase [Proteobacteria bacterium]|nr:sulfotransferase [Pseudomonadota bacterium]